MRRLWTGKRVNFNGKHYSVENAASIPAPVHFEQAASMVTEGFFDFYEKEILPRL
jgi:hypothetical protein